MRRALGLALVLIAATALHLPTGASARRPPAADEASGVHAALVDHLACCTRRGVGALRLHRMVVSTVDPRYAAEEVSGLLSGPLVAVLRGSGRRWRVVAFGGSVYVGCAALPPRVLRDLFGPRWCGPV